MNDKVKAPSEEFENMMDLAALAGVDTTGEKGQRFKLNDEGIYVGVIEEAGLKEFETEKGKLFRAGTKVSVMHFEPLDPESKADVEKKIGSVLFRSDRIRPEELKDDLSQMLAQYQAAGFNTKGPIGGVEGAAPGWLDDTIGQRVGLRVKHSAPREDGQVFENIDMMTPKQLIAAGVSWEEMGRPFIDWQGNEVEIKESA